MSEWIKYLGLAIKAGNVLYGLDNILSYKKRIFLIILDDSISTNSKNKLTNFYTKNNIPHITTKSKLDDLLHSNNCKVIGVCNESLAKQIQQKFIEE